MLFENRLKSNMKISIFYERGCVDMPSPGSAEILFFYVTSLERLFLEAAISIGKATGTEDNDPQILMMLSI
jgi:hypothetical protein